MKKLVESFFLLFCSLRLTAALLFVLCSACFVGMFWDQTLSLSEHLSALGDSSLRHFLFRVFELNDVYHSSWFSLSILLLALNLIGCSIHRLPPIWIDIQNPLRLKDKQLYRQVRFKKKIICESRESAEAKMGHFLSGLKIKNPGSDALYIEKHRYARLGVYVVHIALLMIMFGSILTTNLGYEGVMMVEEGRSERFVQVRGPGGVYYPLQLGFSIFCEDFRLRTFVDGTPMAFESDLSILDNGGLHTVKSQTIRVNHPLFYEGFSFYQSSYRPKTDEKVFRLLVAQKGKESKELSLSLGDKIEVDSSQISFRLLRHLEDYGGLGAALEIEKRLDQKRAESFLVFREYPHFDQEVRRGGVAFSFLGSDQIFETGLSVAKRPFLWLVFLGSAFMLVGLIMAFFFRHRRYYARISRSETGYVVELMMDAKRHLSQVKEEMMRRVETL